MPTANASLSCEIRPLNSNEVTAALALLQSGFHADPTMAWCFESERPGYEDRLAGYLRTGHAWHTGAGFPVWAAVEPTSGAQPTSAAKPTSAAQPTLSAVAYVATADVEPAPDQVRILEEQLVSACGARSAERFARYNEAVEAVAPEAPADTVALIATHEEWRGRGTGTAMMRAIIEASEASRASSGVLLDTGNPRNLRFYERLGFASVATVELESLREHVLFRPDS